MRDQLRYSRNTIPSHTISSDNFSRDIERLGRWHIYGTRDLLDPEGLQESIGAEDYIRLDENSESFGLGYRVDLSLRKGRRITQSQGLEYSALGPVAVDPCTFMFRADNDWYPTPLDVIFEVAWWCSDEDVPLRGKLRSILNVLLVSQVIPLYGEKDDLVYWRLSTKELIFNRARLVGILEERWSTSPPSRVYRRA